ncbi:hypothetical protein BDQ94DRAFT_150421 [Aspergillus welwitschiae]|uniref:Uncharacterized protein n=1 Tax=Aspergillus welwitschiae TaxID=1341132 RepID=A0A3F3PRR5_9EURO|nr:hypothetical protein BDQ94DRAFT_150421 [Aspergillus welwitschiae]RDH29508.1 hypothetical protein BDQ94DRAFT_150421 [Aspergillus welwitschiae]
MLTRRLKVSNSLFLPLRMPGWVHCSSPFSLPRVSRAPVRESFNFRLSRPLVRSNASCWGGTCGRRLQSAFQ